MFHKGQLVRIDPFKLYDAYPEQSESYLRKWYRNFRVCYYLILIVDYVNEVCGKTVVHVFIKYLNGKKFSSYYRIDALVPVQEKDFDFVDIEFFI